MLFVRRRRQQAHGQVVARRVGAGGRLACEDVHGIQYQDSSSTRHEESTKRRRESAMTRRRSLVRSSSSVDLNLAGGTHAAPALTHAEAQRNGSTTAVVLRSHTLLLHITCHTRRTRRMLPLMALLLLMLLLLLFALVLPSPLLVEVLRQPFSAAAAALQLPVLLFVAGD